MLPKLVQQDISNIKVTLFTDITRFGISIKKVNISFSLIVAVNVLIGLMGWWKDERY